jgi:hypothetical protein
MCDRRVREGARTAFRMRNILRFCSTSYGGAWCGFRNGASAAALHRLHALDLRRNGDPIDELLQHDQAACGLASSPVPKNYERNALNRRSKADVRPPKVWSSLSVQ